jgi:hypothetical protein
MPSLLVSTVTVTVTVTGSCQAAGRGIFEGELGESRLLLIKALDPFSLVYNNRNVLGPDCCI